MARSAGNTSGSGASETATAATPATTLGPRARGARWFYLLRSYGLRELAEQFGIRRETVSAALERAGIARRYHERRAVDLERADELHAGGLSITKVAEALGVGAILALALAVDVHDAHGGAERAVAAVGLELLAASGPAAVAVPAVAAATATVAAATAPGRSERRPRPPPRPPCWSSSACAGRRSP